MNDLNSEYKRKKRVNLLFLERQTCHANRKISLSKTFPLAWTCLRYRPVEHNKQWRGGWVVDRRVGKSVSAIWSGDDVCETVFVCTQWSFVDISMASFQRATSKLIKKFALSSLCWMCVRSLAFGIWGWLCHENKH